MFPDGHASKLFTMLTLRHRHRATFLPLAALLLAALFGQDAPADQRSYDSRALSHYLDGDFAMMQGDFAGAAAAYKRALRYDIGSATIYLALAEAFQRQKLLEEAAAAGEQARRLQPEDAQVYEFLARNAAARQQTGEALEHLDRWARLDDGNLDPLFRKASLFLRQNDFTAAADTYLEIYDRDPRQEQVLSRAGEISLSAGDNERAYQAYQRLHSRRPDDHRITRTYAELSVRTKRVDQAIAAFESLEASGGATLAASLQLAWLYVQGAEIPRARTMLNELLEQGHRQWDVLNLAGHVAERMSDFEELARVASLMTEVYPDSVGGYTRLAIAMNSQKDKVGAVEVLEHASSLFPADANIHYLLGSLYFGTDRFAEAEAALLTALVRRPKARHIQSLLATNWSSMGRFVSSDSLYEVVLATGSENASVMNNYAYSMAERSQVSRQQLRYARKLSRASLKLQPDNSAFLDTYGWIWYRLNWYRTARKYIARSLEIQPENAVVLEHLAEVYMVLGKPGEAEAAYVRAEQVRQRTSPSMVRAPEE